MNWLTSLSVSLLVQMSVLIRDLSHAPHTWGTLGLTSCTCTKAALWHCSAESSQQRERTGATGCIQPRWRLGRGDRMSVTLLGMKSWTTCDAFSTLQTWRKRERCYLDSCTTMDSSVYVVWLSPGLSLCFGLFLFYGHLLNTKKITPIHFNIFMSNKWLYIHRFLCKSPSWGKKSSYCVGGRM